MLRLVWQLAGPERIVAITDAIAAAGLSDGTYFLGGLPIKVGEGIARLENGTLAGGTLSLDQAVKNMLKIGIPINEALAMVSDVPARSIGQTSLGRLSPGFPADLVVLDHDLNVKRTYIAGELRFIAD